MLKTFPKVDLIMTDTDSLFMSVQCSENYDVYDDMIKNHRLYDLSNVERGNLYNKIVEHCQRKQINLKDFLNKNKAVIGKMKNETPNDDIVEAVSIKAKCYDFVTNSDNACHKKLKGVKKYVVKQDITHEDYVKCVEQQQTKSVTQKSLRSYNHEVYTIQQEKLALTSFNDKRYILDDGITTRAYGNYLNY